MKYQSDILNEIIDKEGHITSLLHYESECIEHAINEIESIEDTNQRHFEWYNVKIYKL